MADLLFCSHYPFSKQAKEYVSSSGIELTSGRLDKAEERVRSALLEGKIRRTAEIQSAQEEEIVSYAICRMIVSAANNRYLINRYAVAEAKRAGELLSSDEAARPDYIDEMANDFGIKFAKEGPLFSLPIALYLKFTPRSVDYKLSNRDVKDGKVKVKRHERLRILEEAVKKKMESELPIRAQFSDEVKAAGARILAILPKLEVVAIKVGQEDYPPCIRKLLEELALNINLPHTARVSLGIYLIKAGLKDEEIVSLFRSAPDFSEKTTRYQVEYLRNKNYSMPSCTTMDSYGICVAECRCGNPVNFKQAIHGARLKREAEREVGANG